MKLFVVFGVCVLIVLADADESQNSRHSSQQGIPGPKGAVGSPGLPGYRGDPGAPGPDGSRGEKGDRGFPGRDGRQGLDGFPGRDGFPGIQGPTGPQGPRGPAGGFAGPGTEVIKGPPGDSGLPGYPGEIGEPGLPGRDGPPGDGEAVVAFSGIITGVERPRDDYEVMTFDVTTVNVGGGLTSQSTIFYPPVRGLYIFQAVAIANGNSAAPLVLRHNTTAVMTSGRSDSSATGAYPIGVNHVILLLEPGDTVQLVLKPTTGFFSNILGLVYSPSDVTFSGYLLRGIPDNQLPKQQQHPP